jgi:hypothetical protein
LVVELQPFAPMLVIFATSHDAWREKREHSHSEPEPWEAFSMQDQCLRRRLWISCLI